jgi:hypothetical protein
VSLSSSSIHWVACPSKKTTTSWPASSSWLAYFRLFAIGPGWSSGELTRNANFAMLTRAGGG